MNAWLAACIAGWILFALAIALAFDSWEGDESVISNKTLLAFVVGLSCGVTCSMRLIIGVLR